jgi:hypothetical protein
MITTILAIIGACALLAIALFALAVLHSKRQQTDRIESLKDTVHARCIAKEVEPAAYLAASDSVLMSTERLVGLVLQVKRAEAKAELIELTKAIEAL